MGAVYRAFDRNRGEEIAVKVLLPHLLRNPAARERFVAEAKIASALSHPNIVNVYDVQRDGELDLLTMELLQGGTLRQLMRRRSEARQTFSVEEALGVALAIGAALTYAHRRTLHRDVKPENVWVEEDGTYKLMDFGLARLMSESNLTATRATMGSAYYMAPEQIKSAKTIDARADQYSLAVIPPVGLRMWRSSSRRSK
jgi:serine/threonine protein kinase